MNLLGFDIGGTKCATVLGRTDSPDKIEITDRLSFATKAGSQATLNRLYADARALLKNHHLENKDIAGIGISCGGPLDSHKGVILSPPNLPGWDEIPIVEMTEKEFGVPAFLQNDANACALAEWRYGAGRGYDHLVFCTFATGFGAGLILNGQLCSGACDLAGEVGHMRLSDSGPVGFGKEGSFEGWCSGGGIARLGQSMAREKLRMGERTGYCDSPEKLHEVTAASLAEAALNGDPTALEVYRLSSEYLGKGLALIIDILNPQLIILGTIFVRSRELIEKTMWEAIRREAIPLSAGVCKIVPAALGEQLGDMAALVLAAEAAKK